MKVIESLKTKTTIDNRKATTHKNFRNEDGAIDLSSIMVGIIVIGLIGGVIAATIFAIIPWAQDNAAKQQLDSVKAAQSSYMGLTSDPSNPLGVGTGGAKVNSYGSSVELAAANLLKNGTTYCVTTSTDGKSWTAFSRAANGNIWSSTDKDTSPVIFTGTLPTDCTFIAGSSSDMDGDGIPNSTDPDIDGDGVPNAQDEAPEDASIGVYVDPTPKLTVLTFQCDTATTGMIPLRGNVTGTETWSDGVTNTYNGAANTTARTLNAGVTYKVTFDGTYMSFTDVSVYSTSTLTAKCLVSMDHWGQQTGVTSALSAFYGAKKLTSVPKHIPSTITSLYYAFYNADSFNDPNISKWDVSNVSNLGGTFYWADIFNQSLNDWNVSNVTNLNSTFANTPKFNQPLDKWNTSKVTDLTQTFSGAKDFNQPLNTWKTSNVTKLFSTFHGASSFDQPLDKWDTAKVNDMTQTFTNATKFNQPLHMWNTAKVTSMMNMFMNATSFNYNISNWNTAAFDYSSQVTIPGANFVPASFPTAYMPLRTTKQA